MNTTFILTMGYIFITILLISFIICLCYWFYKLIKCVKFIIENCRFTDTYFYKIRHYEKWRNAYEGAKYLDEKFYIERRKRYHIFSKFKQLSGYKSLEEAKNIMDTMINSFEKDNK